MCRTSKIIAAIMSMVVALSGCTTLKDMASSLPLVGGTIKAAVEDKPSEIETTIIADDKLNPDAQGRPAPLILRIYALSDDSVFLTADFFALYEDDKTVLGDKLVSRQELQIRPGETRELDDWQLTLETTRLGVMGAYRDLENATWRVSQVVEPNENYALTLQLEPLAIKLELDD